MCKAAPEESPEKRSRDIFTIGPLEVILIGKTIEVLRGLPHGLESSELWERVQMILPECSYG